MNWLTRYRKWALLLALAVSVACIIVIPYYVNPQTHSSELWLRIPLFLISCLGLLAALLISKKREEKPVDTDTTDDEKTAIVFVHGMGVQDRFQMVGAFSTGLQLASEQYDIVEDPAQAVRVDSITLLGKPRGSAQYSRIDVYEAYWGHKFSGLARWQGTVIFGLLAFMKAIPSLFTRVWKKRLFDLIFGAIGFALVALASITIYGGFRLTAAEIGTGRADHFVSVRQRVDEMFESISSAFQEGIAAISGRAGDLNLTLALDQLRARAGLEIALAIVYSIAWSLMILAAVRFGVAAMGLRTYPRAHETARRTKFKSDMGSLKQQALTGAAATLVYLLLDPYVGMFLVKAMLYASLLYLVVWGVKYWFTNFLGDVQIYTSTDWNNAFYKARDEAIDIVTLKIDEVVSAGYSRVLVVAHSLGSAVTLTALRRLSIKHGQVRPALPDNIVGFVTIGSPLRKIRQLFRTRPYKWKYLEFNSETDRLIFGDGVDGRRPPWHNFWYYTDLFADPLSAIKAGNTPDETSFNVTEKRDICLRPPAAIWAHSAYWEDDRFVDPMLDVLFKDAAR
ncbi:MAG: hypothetical protein M3R13_00105 [Armatimonadota bacterium]|nr:hypothetical protein [Armatimonadota bacterium]